MKSIFIFALCLAGCAGFAWLAGYDFSTRNIWVALGVSASVAVSAFIAFPFLSDDGAGDHYL